MNLYTPLPRHVVYNGRRFHINATYRSILKVFAVMADDILTNIEKLEVSLGILTRKWEIRRLSPIQRGELFRLIFDDFINVSPKRNTSGQKQFDFEQDAAYIIAAFRQCYGMDLLGKDKKLHWWIFLSLLNGLSDDTRLMQIISIRCRKLPKPTKYNAEERKELLRLKQIYRLNISEEEKRKQFQNGLANIAMVLQGMANQK